MNEESSERLIRFLERADELLHSDDKIGMSLLVQEGEGLLPMPKRKYADESFRWNLGSLYDLLDNVDRMDEVLEPLYKDEDSRLFYPVLRMKAFSLMRHHKRDEGLSILLSMQEYALRKNENNIIAESSCFLGEWYFEIKNYDTAIHYFGLAKHSAQEIHSAPLVARATIPLTLIAIREKRLGVALNELRELVAISQEHADKINYAIAMSIRAYLYSLQNDTDSVNTSLKAIYDSINNR